MKTAGYKRNFGSKTNNSHRYEMRAIRDVNKKRGCKQHNCNCNYCIAQKDLNRRTKRLKAKFNQ